MQDSQMVGSVQQDRERKKGRLRERNTKVDLVRQISGHRETGRRVEEERSRGQK